MPTAEILEIISPGAGATLQDQGRRGWRRFGVPPGGAMDNHAAMWANRLLDNPAGAPVLELLLHGATLRVLRDTWIAITGANMSPTHAPWRVSHVAAGVPISFPRPAGGVWTYVAVEGGFAAPRVLGSASAFPRGGIGRSLGAGDILSHDRSHLFHLPEHVGGRVAPWTEQRNYAAPPVLRAWRGPQWDSFSEADRQKFFDQAWTVTSQSDRAGYRLAGEPLAVPPGQIISEPVREGTIQVPENGQPIVTLRDGPTVGGYAKFGMIDPADLPWLVQACPGQSVRFQPV